jgi:hypothetical protein
MHRDSCTADAAERVRCDCAPQAWLALHNLVTDPACRAKAHHSQARARSISKMRPAQLGGC